MDELLRGVSLLGPQLNDLTRRLEELSAQVPEIKADLAKKADAADVEKLQLELRAVAEGQGKLVAKADFEDLGAKVEALGAKAAEAAEGSQLEARVAAFDAQLQGLKASSAQASESLAAQLRGLSASVGQKAGSADLASVGSRFKALEEAMAEKAPASEAARLSAEVQSLSADMSRKPDVSLVEQLSEMCRTLTTTLGQKAEHTEVEVMKIKLHALNGTVTQKFDATSSDIEATTAQLQALAHAAASATKTSDELKDVRGQLHNLGNEIALKAENERVEGLLAQFQVLSDMLAPRMRTMASPRPRSAKGPRRAPNA